MIISENFISAKLDAIAKLVDDNVKEVKIFFDKEKNCWCVKWEIFSEEEWEKLNCN